DIRTEVPDREAGEYPFRRKGGCSTAALVGTTPGAGTIDGKSPDSHRTPDRSRCATTRPAGELGLSSTLFDGGRLGNQLRTPERSFFRQRPAPPFSADYRR